MNDETRRVCRSCGKVYYVTAENDIDMCECGEMLEDAGATEDLSDNK